MGKTSTESKRKYNEKTYSVYSCQIRKEEFEILETMRGTMSRSGFLKALAGFWQKNGAPDLTAYTLLNETDHDEQ